MRAAIYIRVSTDREEWETSLINQRQYFENYIREHGWDIYEFYVDIESGTKKNRKDLKRLILDGKQKSLISFLQKSFLD